MTKKNILRYMSKQAYIVVFNSDNHKTDIANVIKAFGTWGRITTNAYIVVSYQTASEIRDIIKSTAGPKDTVFVLRSGAIAAWSNTPAKNDWLKQYL